MLPQVGDVLHEKHGFSRCGDGGWLWVDYLYSDTPRLPRQVVLFPEVEVCSPVNQLTLVKRVPKSIVPPVLPANLPLPDSRLVLNVNQEPL